MKHFSLSMMLSICYALLVNISLYGYGFNEHTLVHVHNSCEAMRQIFNYPDKEWPNIASYDLKSATSMPSTIKAAQEGYTNCYVEIGFDNSSSGDCDIVCSPVQRFYVPALKRWVPAYKLKIGDLLLSAHNELKPITHAKFIKKRLKIYTIEVENTHIFCVGKHAILTHNMVEVAVGISIAFGEGAVAGGSSGSFFGPITFFGGIVIGGVIGVVAYFYKKKKPQYHLSFNTKMIEQTINHTNTLEQKQKEITTCFPTSEHGICNTFVLQPQDSNKINALNQYIASCFPAQGQSAPIVYVNANDKDNENKHPHGVYDGAGYHYKTKQGRKNPAPTDGQKALDHSVPIDRRNPKRRIGLSEGEIVILDRTHPGSDIYHGHIRSWAELDKGMVGALRDEGWAHPKRPKIFWPPWSPKTECDK